MSTGICIATAGMGRVGMGDKRGRVEGRSAEPTLVAAMAVTEKWREVQQGGGGCIVRLWKVTIDPKKGRWSPQPLTEGQGAGRRGNLDHTKCGSRR